MPVTDDEMYRQLAADYFHHLAWREKLFGGFLVLIGALALAFYYTHRRDQEAELLFRFGWLIPVVGSVLSLIFFFLERRCQEVLIDRRNVGHALEQRSQRDGLFASVVTVGDEARHATHSGVLQTLYLGSFVALFVISAVDISWRCGGRG